MDILAADLLRRHARWAGEATDLKVYDPKDGAWINPELTAGIGAINPPRKYPNQKPRTRMSNPAHALESGNWGNGGTSPRVRVTRNGKTEWQAASSFRASRATRVTRQAAKPETAQRSHGHDFTA
jgi:hypothetical protein